MRSWQLNLETLVLCAHTYIENSSVVFDVIGHTSIYDKWEEEYFAEKLINPQYKLKKEQAKYVYWFRDYVILSHSFCYGNWLLNYVKYLVKKRYIPAERIFCTNPTLAYHYTIDVVGGEFPVAEHTFLSSPQYSYYYARDVLKRPWPEGEPVISQDCVWAYYYAKDVLKGRFPLGEKSLFENPRYAWWYARDVVGIPLSEAEDSIKKVESYALMYENHFNIRL